ncbi:MAG: halocarboxylic acid dehydrogenase DehI family protein [Candidatus Korobacteraceae bacterium]
MRWKRGNRLKLASEAEAPPPTRKIFDEVRHALGSPVVPKLYQGYAAFPEFLELHWQAFRPVLETRQFFLLGARLAAECYTRAHNYFAVRGMASRDSRREAAGALPISQVLDYYQYLDPLLLLIATAQMRALEGPIGQAQAERDAAHHPCFPIAPTLLNDEDATPQVHGIWSERQQMLSLAFVSDEHRALATWPRFYQEYWSLLKDLLQSPLYADCQSRIVESAWGLASELPVKVETDISHLLDVGLSEEGLSLLAQTNEEFVQALSALVLDITFARIACEGGTRCESRASQKPPAADGRRKKASSPTRAA